MTRLENDAQQVAQKLRQAPAGKQRAASWLACRLALESTELLTGENLTWLEQLREKGALPAHTRAELSNLVARTDEKAFDLQDQASDDPRMEQEYIRVFRQARALSALCFAAEEDALAAAMESIYEASAAVNDASTLYTRVLAALKD